MGCFRIFGGRSGSSTLQILALTSIIGLSFYGVSSHQAQVITELMNERAQRYYVEMYHGLLESVLRNPVACAATFTGTSPVGAVAQIRTSPAVVVFSSGAPLNSNGTNVVRVNLQSISWASVGDSNGKDLDIVYSAQVGNKIKTYSRSIRINYTLSGTIQNCSASDLSSLAQACDSLNGTLINAKCVSPRISGTLTINGSVSTPRATVAGTATTSSFVVGGSVSSNGVIVGGASSLNSLAGASLTSSSVLNANSLNATSFPICAGGGCQTWATRACGVNQYMYAILSNGDISCASW